MCNPERHLMSHQRLILETYGPEAPGGPTQTHTWANICSLSWQVSRECSGDPKHNVFILQNEESSMKKPNKCFLEKNILLKDTVRRFLGCLQARLNYFRSCPVLGLLEEEAENKARASGSCCLRRVAVCLVLGEGPQANHLWRGVPEEEKRFEEAQGEPSVDTVQTAYNNPPKCKRPQKHYTSFNNKKKRKQRLSKTIKMYIFFSFLSFLLTCFYIFKPQSCWISLNYSSQKRHVHLHLEFPASA